MPLCKRKYLFIVLASVILFVSIGFWIIYISISYSLTAEHALHANLLMIDILREYVIDNKGAWPQSWQDLERLPSQQRAMFTWPDDKEEIQHYVSIDFGADPDKLATKSVDEFNAVQPLGPCYPFKHYPEVAKLLDAIKISRGSEVKKVPQ